MAIENTPCPLCAFRGNPPGSKFCAICGTALPPGLPRGRRAQRRLRPWQAY